MDKRRGGCAPNIAYTLALLGEKPQLMATAGEDFGEYRAWLEAAGVDTSLARQIDGKFCASFFCSTDLHNNQIASFYTGAMADAGQLSFRSVADCGLAIIAPNDPGAMVQYAEECRTLDIPFIFDPGQQCARMEGDQLRDGITGATIVIVNDYELELLRQKTGMGEKDILVVAKTLIVTKGENGSSVITSDGQVDVQAVTPARIVDPTGVGDAFRGGLMKGLAAAGLPMVAPDDARARAQEGKTELSCQSAQCWSRLGALTNTGYLVSGSAVRDLCVATGVPSQIVDSYQYTTVAIGAINSGNTDLTPEEADKAMNTNEGQVMRPWELWSRAVGAVE